MQPTRGPLVRTSVSTPSAARRPVKKQERHSQKNPSVGRHGGPSESSGPGGSASGPSGGFVRTGRKPILRPVRTESDRLEGYPTGTVPGRVDRTARRFVALAVQESWSAEARKVRAGRTGVD